MSDPVGVVRCGNFVVENQTVTDESLTVIGVRHTLSKTQIKFLAAEAPALAAAVQKFVGPSTVLGTDEAEGGPLEQWTQIGAMCSAGRRSLWVKFEMADPEARTYAEASVRRIHARAGREGHDVTIAIGHDNPQFAELLALFLCAKFAAET